MNTSNSNNNNNNGSTWITAIRPGYWRLLQTTASLQCPFRETACIGNNIGALGDAQCDDKFGGFLCALPRDKYTLTASNSSLGGKNYSESVYLDWIARDALSCNSTWNIGAPLLLSCMSVLVFIYFVFGGSFTKLLRLGGQNHAKNSSSQKETWWNRLLFWKKKSSAEGEKPNEESSQHQETVAPPVSKHKKESIAVMEALTSLQILISALQVVLTRHEIRL